VDGSIGELRCEYQVPGPESASRTGHLDRLVRTELVPALEATLDAVYGDDPAVYVLRDVHAELALRTDGRDPARTWGEALTTAIATTIAEDPGDGMNLVRFADQAEYLACYLADHLSGHAWRHWYYRALAGFHGLSAAEVVPAVLSLERPVAVLAALHRQGALPRALAALDPSALAELAASVLGRFGPAQHGTDDLGGVWPLLVAATRIADVWALWTDQPRPAVEVARDYRNRPVPNWHDPAALTLVVLDVLRHLETLGELRRPPGPPPAALAAEFEWLDLSLLAQGLTGAKPVRRDPTPREREVLRVLLDVVGSLSLNGPGPEAVVRIRAALAAENPEWTDDPTADAVVARVIARWRSPAVRPVVPESDEDRVLALLTSSEMCAVDGYPEESEYAGLLLLVRAVTDLRVPAVLSRAGLADALPETLVHLATRLTGAEPEDPAVRAFAGNPRAPTDFWAHADPAQCRTVRDGLTAILAAHGVGELDGLGESGPGLSDASETLGLLALGVLRAWSRWLGELAGSSVPYLRGHFLCRPGTLRWSADELVVDLAPRPLDTVLDLAGYLDLVENVPWLGGRPVVFRLEAA
jgi:hypothetical protein